VNKEMVLREAQCVNWKSDGKNDEHLWTRRVAMAQVIDFCVGIGIDVGCQANKIVPTTAAYAHCIGIEQDKQTRYMLPKSRWTADRWEDGQHIKAHDNSLNWLYAGHSVEDQPYPKGTIEILAEFYRVVKNGGYVAMLFPHKRYYPNVGQPGANQAHQHDWLPEEIWEFIQTNLKGKFFLAQLETFYNHFEFDIVLRVVKDNDYGRLGENK
jgi:ubiquinone/menaquinone biosynthesis C-methylase UbiE